MGFENFNPRDEKYKKVADLPGEEQEKYQDVEGGFITKEAFREDTKNSVEAKRQNKERPFLDKILFKNKISKQDIARVKADIINGDIEFEKLVMALPESEQEELRGLKGIEEELATGEGEDGFEIYIDELSEKELEVYARYCTLLRKAQDILKNRPNQDALEKQRERYIQEAVDWLNSEDAIGWLTWLEEVRENGGQEEAERMDDAEVIDEIIDKIYMKIYDKTVLDKKSEEAWKKFQAEFPKELIREQLIRNNIIDRHGNVLILENPSEE